MERKLRPVTALRRERVASDSHGRGGGDPHAARGRPCSRRIPALGAAGMLPLGGGNGRVDEGEGARREGDLARADTEESAELSKLGPPLAGDEVGRWVAVAVEVCDRQQKEQCLPLGGGTEVVVDLLHDIRIG